MAARVSAGRRGQTYQNHIPNQRQMYVYGNVVPKPVYEEPVRHAPRPRRRKKVSAQVKQNRRQAMGMSRAYVVFLTFAAVLMLVVCVNYVQLRSELTSRSKNITALQEKLVALNEENTTKYNSIMDAVNLEEVREKALDELGMVYASDSQVIEYDNPTGDYIKQYDQIPEEGVLANSADVEN